MKYLLVALLLSLASCATLITGSEDSVEVLSNPPGAHFTTNTGHQGTTPSSISIPDDVDLEVSYSLAGYADRTVVLESRMSGWIFGNILIGGIIGLVIDLATGDYKTHGASITATLKKVEAVPQP